MSNRADELQGRLRTRLETSNMRQVARDVGVSHVTLGAFLRGETVQPETIGKIRAFLDRPVAGRDEYWAGVNYAALAMSETVTRLLREMANARASSPIALAERIGEVVAKQRESDAATPPTRRRKGNG